jgi:hypothetical protein
MDDGGSIILNGSVASVNDMLALGCLRRLSAPTERGSNDRENCLDHINVIRNRTLHTCGLRFVDTKQAIPARWVLLLEHL